MSSMNIRKLFSHEVAYLILLLTGFLIVGIVASSKWPIVWRDEVQLLDPAANLFFNRGFTSAAWYVQTQDEFWAGNAPLFSFLLYLWMRLLGFGLVEVRSLNYFLIVGSVIIIWLAVQRFQLIKRSLNRIVLVVILLCGSGITFNFRSVRYDCLCILLVSLLFLSSSVHSSRVRYPLLVFISFFVPFSGIQLIPYIPILGGTIFLFYRPFWKNFIAILIGMTLGVTGLLLFYQLHGVLPDFIASFQVNASTAATRFSGVKADPSFRILFVTACILAVYRALFSTQKVSYVLLFGISLSLGVPTIMFLLSKYPIYYSWMAFIPLSICICTEIDAISLSEFPLKQKRWLLFLTSLMLLTACLRGLPDQLLGIVNEWEARNYSVVESFVEKNVPANSWVYSDYVSYYAAKQTTSTVILPTYLQYVMPDFEKEQVSILVIDPEALQPVVAELGGTWIESSEVLEMKSRSFWGDAETLYKLQVFARTS